MNHNYPKDIDIKYISNSTVGFPDEKIKKDALNEVLKREKEMEYRKQIETKLNGGIVKEEEETGASLTKRNPNYHYLHGKAYDLRPFFEKHPGGADILKLTQGLIDATPTFEMYHAFANRPMIMKQLETYRVDDGMEELYKNDHGIYSFDDNGFYRTLTRRVRAHFGAVGPDADKKSLTKETKANGYWLAKVSIQATISVIFYYLAFFHFTCQLATTTATTNSYMNNSSGGNNNKCVDTWNNTIKSGLCAIFAANFFIQWGFTVMHDASHFAIAPRNHWINLFMTRLWCALSLWVCRVWMLHHAVMHHSFTGVEKLDPDIHHAMPLVRKHPDVARGKVARIFRLLGDTFGMYGWGIAALTLYAFIPGMWLGQVLQYFAFSFGILHWKELWGMTYPKNDAYKTQIWENIIILIQIGVQIHRWNPFVTYAYIVALNISYATCIVADHDTVEASVTNHIDVDITLPAGVTNNNNNNEPEKEPKNQSKITSNYGKVDWGETQVRNSSNFVNHWAGDIFAFLHGSINYQTEHHLYPGMSHIHLPSISPIVRQTCEEFNIPYTAYPSMRAAWYSFLVTLRSCMTIKDIPQEQESISIGHEKTE